MGRFALKDCFLVFPFSFRGKEGISFLLLHVAFSVWEERQIFFFSTLSLILTFLFSSSSLQIYESTIHANPDMTKKGRRGRKRKEKRFEWRRSLGKKL